MDARSLMLQTILGTLQGSDFSGNRHVDYPLQGPEAPTQYGYFHNPLPSQYEDYLYHLHQMSPKCPPDWHRCVSDRMCVPPDAKCNHVRECADGSDEQGCYPECEMVCLENPYQCLPEHELCNGQPFCFEKPYYFDHLSYDKSRPWKHHNLNTPHFVHGGWEERSVEKVDDESESRTRLFPGKGGDSKKFSYVWHYYDQWYHKWPYTSLTNNVAVPYKPFQYLDFGSDEFMCREHYMGDECDPITPSDVHYLIPTSYAALGRKKRSADKEARHNMFHNWMDYVEAAVHTAVPQSEHTDDTHHAHHVHEHVHETVYTPEPIASAFPNAQPTYNIPTADETGCAEFTCLADDSCIDFDDICDDTSDCPDMEDEFYCESDCPKYDPDFDNVHTFYRFNYQYSAARNHHKSSQWKKRRSAGGISARDRYVYFSKKLAQRGRLARQRVNKNF